MTEKVLSNTALSVPLHRCLLNCVCVEARLIAPSHSAGQETVELGTKGRLLQNSAVRILRMSITIGPISGCVGGCVGRSGTSILLGGSGVSTSSAR